MSVHVCARAGVCVQVGWYLCGRVCVDVCARAGVCTHVRERGREMDGHLYNYSLL